MLKKNLTIRQYFFLYFQCVLSTVYHFQCKHKDQKPDNTWDYAQKQQRYQNNTGVESLPEQGTGLEFFSFSCNNYHNLLKKADYGGFGVSQELPAFLSHQRFASMSAEDL